MLATTENINPNAGGRDVTVIQNARAEIAHGAFTALKLIWNDDAGTEHNIFVENGDAIALNDELSRMDTDEQKSRRLSEVISELAY